MIARMVFSTAVALIFTQAAGTVAELIDGMITSRFIGQDAYSAVSLLRPFTGMISLLASFLATGSQVVCARLVGTGEHEEANRVLTLSAGIAAVLSAAILAGCVFFPRQVFSVCGVSVETQVHLAGDQFKVHSGMSCRPRTHYIGGTVGRGVVGHDQPDAERGLLRGDAVEAAFHQIRLVVGGDDDRHERRLDVGCGYHVRCRCLRMRWATSPQKPVTPAFAYLRRQCSSRHARFSSGVR